MTDKLIEQERSNMSEIIKIANELKEAISDPELQTSEALDKILEEVEKNLRYLIERFDKQKSSQS